MYVSIAFVHIYIRIYTYMYMYPVIENSSQRLKSQNLSLARNCLQQLRVYPIRLGVFRVLTWKPKKDIPNDKIEFVASASTSVAFLFPNYHHIITILAPDCLHVIGMEWFAPLRVFFESYADFC